MALNRISLIASIILISTANSFGADKLPINDGIYVKSQADCDLYNKRQLEMVPLTIEKNGQEFSFEEGYCIPKIVNKLRGDRYVVDSDCDEFGEKYRAAYIFEKISNNKVLVDDRELLLCKQQKTQPLKKALSKKDAQPLFQKWLEAARGCNASGDNPKTYEACERRYKMFVKLEQNGWCYGKETDQSRAEYNWHICTPDSLRHSRSTD